MSRSTSRGLASSGPRSETLREASVHLLHPERSTKTLDNFMVRSWRWWFAAAALIVLLGLLAVAWLGWTNRSAQTQETNARIVTDVKAAALAAQVNALRAQVERLGLTPVAPLAGFGFAANGTSYWCLPDTPGSSVYACTRTGGTK